MSLRARKYYLKTRIAELFFQIRELYNNNSSGIFDVQIERKKQKLYEIIRKLTQYELKTTDVELIKAISDALQNNDFSRLHPLIERYYRRRLQI